MQIEQGDFVSIPISQRVALREEHYCAVRAGVVVHW
jgi:hypothetical protein